MCYSSRMLVNISTSIQNFFAICKLGVAASAQRFICRFRDVARVQTIDDARRILVTASVSLASFALGVGLGLSAQLKTPTSSIRLVTENSVPYITESSSQLRTVSPESQGKYVASRKGKKYHGIWCSGAQTIAAKNKRYFLTAEEARNAGYTAASNCPGIE
jgi:hypothetical protein